MLKNCSGIVITGNEISNSTIEGLTVNEKTTLMHRELFLL